MLKSALYEKLSALDAGQIAALRFGALSAGGALTGAALDKENRKRGGLIGLGAGSLGGASTLMKPPIVVENPLTRGIMRATGFTGAATGGGFMGSNVSKVLEDLRKKEEPPPPPEPHISIPVVQQMIDAGVLPQQILETAQIPKVATDADPYANDAGITKSEIQNAGGKALGYQGDKGFIKKVTSGYNAYGKAGDIDAGKKAINNPDNVALNTVFGKGQKPVSTWDAYWNGEEISNWAGKADTKVPEGAKDRVGVMTPEGRENINAAKAAKFGSDIAKDPAIKAKAEAAHPMASKEQITEGIASNVIKSPASVQGAVKSEAMSQAGDWMKNNWGYLLGGLGVLAGGAMLLSGGGKSSQANPANKGPRNPYENPEVDWSSINDPNKSKSKNPWIQ